MPTRIYPPLPRPSRSRLHLRSARLILSEWLFLISLFSPGCYPQPRSLQSGRVNNARESIMARTPTILSSAIYGLFLLSGITATPIQHEVQNEMLNSRQETGRGTGGYPAASFPSSWLPKHITACRQSRTATPAKTIVTISPILKIPHSPSTPSTCRSTRPPT